MSKLYESPTSLSLWEKMAEGRIRARCCAVITFVVAFFAFLDATRAGPLRGTDELDWQGDLAARMVDGLHTFLDRATAESIDRRARHWNRDTSSPEAYAKSIEPNRRHLSEILGVVDERVADPDFMKRRIAPEPSEENRLSNLYELRWAVLPGVRGEGFVFESREEPDESYIIIPDADVLPETVLQHAGEVDENWKWTFLTAGVVHSSKDLFVVAPINRDNKYSVVLGKPTGHPHREHIYRQAFEMGRHIVGYEVQKVLALVDDIRRRNIDPTKPHKITVYGQGEGGL
ncbi:MAG TPA: hypothetical protein VHV77_16485, partial [Pirellulales bacterium]|nr:hypothetical protein [Pirellulales bacterium]